MVHHRQDRSWLPIQTTSKGFDAVVSATTSDHHVLLEGSHSLAWSELQDGQWDSVISSHPLLLWFNIVKNTMVIGVIGLYVTNKFVCQSRWEHWMVTNYLMLSVILMRIMRPILSCNIRSEIIFDNTIKNKRFALDMKLNILCIGISTIIICIWGIS